MNSPIRLLESSPNPTARTLLQAGLRERPQPAALRSTALALGVGGSLAAASASAAAGAGATAIVAPVVAPSLTLMVGKWVALGMVGGVALAGGASLVTAPAAQVATTTIAKTVKATPAASPAKSASPSHAPEVPSLEPEVQGAPPAAATAESKPAPGRKARVEMTATSAAAPASASLPNAQSLSREIAMIDASRRALSSGSAAAALAQLDEYAASLRTGTLDREAQLLRIDALALAGQRAAALRLAERYLASYPNDPHATRLRELSRTP